MLVTTVKIQLVVFTILTLLGVSFVGARYAGLVDAVTKPGYTVTGDFPESGGIFENAQVAYRGLQIGKVERLRLTEGGVLVDLRIDDGVQIPADTKAVVANRSAIGEQFVDLLPNREGEPFLKSGDVIPRANTDTPLHPETLLLNLDRLVNSVNKRSLSVVVDELGKAFTGTAEPLKRLIDGGIDLTEAAHAALPETVKLLEDGETVLQTQVDQAGAIKSFARDLADFTDTLRASDPDLRNLIDVAPAAGAQLRDFIDRIDPQFSTLFSNLITLGEISAVRIPNLKGLLIAYPVTIKGSHVITPYDGSAHFGLVEGGDPPVCKQGYDSTRRRDPLDTSDVPANMNARCTESPTTGVNVRGAQNAPKPSGRAGVADGSYVSPEDVYLAPYNPLTGVLYGPDGQRYVIGSAGDPRLLGEESWKRLFFGPLAGL